jgi:proline iminopeptidase
MNRNARIVRRAFRASAAALLVAAVAGAAGDAEPGARFETGDVSIAYESIGGGDGTPLVLVNGGPGLDHVYLRAPAFERLGRDRPVVYYDQRGTGRSSALEPGQPCGLAEQIADLEALRAHLGIERFDLLGHSWGGYLAMAYAARHPERVAHLVVVTSAPPRIPDLEPLLDRFFPETVERQRALAFESALGDTDAVTADLTAHMSMLFLDPGHRDRLLARMRAEPFDYAPEVNAALWADLQRFDLTPELRALALPALVVHGRWDVNVPPSVGWAIHRAIPGSELAIFERSGHFPQLEEEDAFVARVAEFLARPAR